MIIQLASSTCPHCGQRMLIRHGVQLPPFLADLFDMIEHSKARGVTCEILAGVFYSGKSTREAKNCVKVNISRINDLFASTDVSIHTDRTERFKFSPYRVYYDNSSFRSTTPRYISPNQLRARSRANQAEARKRERTALD
jgi:hypothetical protein